MSKSSSSKTASSVVLKNTTPEFNKSVAKDLGDSIGKVSVIQASKTQSDVWRYGDKLVSKSYSPTVNQLLTNLESLSLLIHILLDVKINNKFVLKKVVR